MARLFPTQLPTQLSPSLLDNLITFTIKRGFTTIETTLPSMSSKNTATGDLVAPLMAPDVQRSQDWASEIKSSNREDIRTQPWKGNYGKPLGGVDDEDWVNYPAVQNMSKKGIKG